MQNIMEMLAGPWITATVIIIINFTSAYSCGQNSFASGGRWCWQIKSNTENVSPIISLYPISVSGVFPVGNSEGAHTKMGPVFFYFTSKTKLQIKLRAKQQMKPPDVLIKVKYVLDWGESGGMDEGQKSNLLEHHESWSTIYSHPFYWRTTKFLPVFLVPCNGSPPLQLLLPCFNEIWWLTEWLIWSHLMNAVGGKKKWFFYL